MSHADLIAALSAKLPELSTAEKAWAESILQRYETPGGHITSREWAHVAEVVGAAP